MIVCNCRRVVSRGDEYRVVKSRKWDCPSCGLDRKRTLARMCGIADARRIITLTLEQPRAVWVGWEHTPGEAPAGVAAHLDNGLIVPGEGWNKHQVHRPERHQHCDSSTHLAWNARHGGYRWRVIPECPHCLRWVSAALSRWIKRMRRLHPGLQYLHAREVHKSGGVHLHVAVTGLAGPVTQRNAAGKLIAYHWRAVGGGFVHVGRNGEHAGEYAGWYVGKYLAKQHDNTFARGFRRWSRAADFAPAVRMGWTPPEDYDGGWHDPLAPVKLHGWLHPDGTEKRWRYWGFAADRPLLDTRTANLPRWPWSPGHPWAGGPPAAPESPAIAVADTWQTEALF